MKLDNLIQESQRLTSDDVDQMMEDLRELINKNFFAQVEMKGGVAYVNRVDRAYIFGDIHGDFETLVNIIKRISPGEPVNQNFPVNQN